MVLSETLMTSLTLGATRPVQIIPPDVQVQVQGLGKGSQRLISVGDLEQHLQIDVTSYCSVGSYEEGKAG